MKKIKFYKGLLIEVIETLCTLCLFMETESAKYGYGGNRYRSHFISHFKELSKYSEALRRGKNKPYEGEDRYLGWNRW